MLNRTSESLTWALPAPPFLQYDIQQFFEGYDVVPGSIKIQESFPGRKTGEAFVEFGSPEEADVSDPMRRLTSVGFSFLCMMR
jgi:hypothetical protein